MKYTFLDFIKRDLTLAIVLASLVFGCALACGSPFLAGTGHAQEPGKQPTQTAPQPQTPNQTQAKSSSWVGTIVKDGYGYSLKESSGSTFKLDDSSKAQQFEGKAVKVTGQLDEQAQMIHVESIESSEG